MAHAAAGAPPGHPPFDGNGGHFAVWTGTEVLFFGGQLALRGDADGAVPIGLSLRPADGTWRPVHGTPAIGHGAQLVWTGSEVLAVGTGPVHQFHPSR